MKRLVTARWPRVLLVAAVAACGSDDDSGGRRAGCRGHDPHGVRRLVADATFEEIGRRVRADHDGVKVEFNFAGSSDLVAQIQQGAPADVFASADEANMEKLTADDLQGSDPQTFASNTLEIAVPPGNPAGIESFQDLAEDGLNLVICAPEVPCGAATQTVAESAGVELKPVSEEQSVTDVLAKVTSGEADAGLVYVTDVIAAGDDVRGHRVPRVRVGREHVPDRHRGRQRERRPGAGVRRPGAERRRASRSWPTPGSRKP